MTKEFILNKYIEIKNETKRRPTVDVLSKAGISKRQINKHFGNLTNLQILQKDQISRFVKELKTCKSPKCTTQFFTKADNKTQQYCSRSCSNQVTKLKLGKYTKIITCVYCGARHNRPYAKYCNSECRFLDFYKKRTLQSCLKRSGSNKYDFVRQHARYHYKNNLDTVCYNCGYDKHVEIAHIKPLTKFENNDLILVVNSLDNLIALCPNCHWEFDHGLLNLCKRSDSN